MLLSIIVPVYNMATNDKLKHCMDSLLNQTVSDYEIIAVDDASTDESVKILREYERANPGKVKVILNEKNMRQGGAKNNGLKHATGTWVGFIDSDDWIHPTMYEKLIAKADTTGADLVGCDYTIVDHYTFDEGRTIINNDDSQTGILDREKHGMHILKPGSMVVKIYLREIIVKNNLSFPEYIFYEDNCAGPLWSMYFNHFERVGEPLYYYLTVGDSTTHHVSWDKCMDRVKAGNMLLEEARNRKLFDTYQEELEGQYASVDYAGTLFSYMYSAKNRKMKNTAFLKRLIKKEFPDFLNNKYFVKSQNKENLKLVRLHIKSNILFFIYYVLLFGYRNLKKK